MRLTTPATLTLLLLAGSPSLAQTRVDQTNPLAPKQPSNALGGGRALDAGLSSQGGRLNTQVRDLDATIRQNNRIINGQAGNGRSFRGSVGYSATDEFGGSLGGDSTYAFRCDSATAAIPTARIRTSDALNYQFALTTGGRPGNIGTNDIDVLRQIAAADSRTRGEAISSGTALSNSPVTNGTSNAGSSTLTTLRSISEYESQSTRLPTLLGYQANPGDKAVYAVTASPLRGVAITPVSGNDAGARGLVGIERVGGGVGSLSSMIGKKYDNGKLVSENAAEKPADPNNLTAKPIDTRLTTSGTSYDRVITSLTQSIDQRFIVSPPSKPAVAPIDPSALPKDPGNKSDPEEKPPAVRDATAPGWISQLDQLKSKLRRDAMLAPIDKDKTNPAKPISPEPPITPIDPADLAAADPLIAALRKSNVKLDELIAKAGPGANNNDAYTRRMQEGQRKLGEGKFFDSEAAFTMALVMKPEDPMARLGRADAQLAAGLFVSASSNLRDLFADNPELVSVKFGPELLPSAARAGEIAQQLQSGLSDPLAMSGGDGGLLLAFLGRQFNDREWIAAGLKNLRERADKKNPEALSLMELLTRVWAE